MMNIEIYPPLALHEVGKRDNNEDSILPSKGSAQYTQRLFLVCDGVGGNAKGEEASKLVCQSFDDKMQHGNLTSNPAVIADALYYAEAEMDRFVQTNPEASGMATTLTLLHLHENGATIAHVGDSRVYHIRERMIRFVTNDHKWVNKLVLSGDLTPEEALHHPRRNVIDRAIQGHLQRSTEADVMQITDIQPGDYFFLCTDGILEGIEEDQLVNILAMDASDTAKMAEIEALCQVNSMDNFSAYLVRVKSVSGNAVEWTPSVMPEEKASDIIMTEARDIKIYETPPTYQARLSVPAHAAPPISSDSYTNTESAHHSSNMIEVEKTGMGLAMPIIIALVCALLVLGGYYFSSQIFGGKAETELEHGKPGGPGVMDPDKEKDEMKPARTGKLNEAKPAGKPNKKANAEGNTKKQNEFYRRKPQEKQEKKGNTESENIENEILNH